MRLALSRRAHRFIAIASAIFLLSSACTGLLWAFSPYLYLDEGYMRKKAPISGPAPTAAVVTVQDAMAAARKAGRSGPVQQATLRSDFGRLLWDVQLRAGGGEGSQSFLMDAVSGETLSPLTAEQATVIAQQYVRGNPPVEGVVAESGFVGRSDRARPAPAYRVRFKQARNPEIVIHRDSGVILADEDSARRFSLPRDPAPPIQLFRIQEDAHGDSRRPAATPDWHGAGDVDPAKAAPGSERPEGSRRDHLSLRD